MPLFSDKFNPRLSKPRKITVNPRSFLSDRLGEESDQLTEFKSLSIKLGDSLNLHFDETQGEWRLDNREENNVSDDNGDEINKETIKGSKSDLVKLQKAYGLLQEENRLLKLKVELLVDLVIEKGETD